MDGVGRTNGGEGGVRDNGGVGLMEELKTNCFVVACFKNKLRDN